MSLVYDKLFSIQSLTTSQDSTGAEVRSFANRIANVECTVWPASPKTIYSFKRPDMYQLEEVATSVDVSAAAGEQVIVDGRTLLVIAYLRYENSDFGNPVYVIVTGKRQQP